MSPRRLLVVLALALAAAILGGGLLARSHEAGAAAGPTATGTPTWKDVAPVFASKCAGCHQLGGIAPFALTSARTAQQHAQAILRVTQQGVMPPWMPGPDSPEYLGQSGRQLTAEEKSLLAWWVRGGARVGAGGTVRPVVPRSRARGTSVTLAPRRAYRPRGAGGGLDDYHCFLLD